MLKAGELTGEGDSFIGEDAEFLGLAAAVDLDENRHDLTQSATPLIDLLADDQGVDRLDHVENFDRLLDFVALKMADEMPFDAAADHGESCLSFLNIVFADDPDARPDTGQDFLGRSGFGSSDKNHMRGKFSEQSFDIGFNGSSELLSVGHLPWLRH